jgi:excisionase family DNA binding protein
MIPIVYKTEEVAKLLRVRPERVRIWIRRGQLKAYRMGGGRRLRISEDHLRQFLGMEPEKPFDLPFALRVMTEPRLPSTPNQAVRCSVSEPAMTPKQAGAYLRRALETGKL